MITMSICGGLTVLAAVLQTILAQGLFIYDFIPTECKEQPRGVGDFMQCCAFPPIFTQEENIKCQQNLALSILGDQKIETTQCGMAKCLFLNNGMVQDNYVNYNAVKRFLDKYASLNPKFEGAIEVVKKRCIWKTTVYKFSEDCTFHKLFDCINRSLFTECPLWQVTRECKTLKKHFDMCRRFFPEKVVIDYD